VIFKRTKTKQIQTWAIEVDGPCYRTNEGILNGVITSSKWTTATPKNVGKANETTAEEQAVKEAMAKRDKKLATGYVINQSDIDDVPKHIQPMLAHLYDPTTPLPFPVFTQPKLDGIRCVAKNDGLFTRNGKLITSCPHILAEARVALNSLPESEFLDGELYNHAFRDNFSSLVSLIKKSKATPESEKYVQFHIYDLVHNPEVTRPSFLVRNVTIGAPFSTMCFSYLKQVQTDVAESQATLDSLYEQYLEMGYEGQIIRLNKPYERCRSKSLLKRKEFIDEECAIIDILEGKGNRLGMAGKMVLKHPNGNEFRASITGGEAFYTELLEHKEQYIGKMATCRYQNLSEYGIPRFGRVLSVRDYE